MLSSLFTSWLYANMDFKFISRVKKTSVVTIGDHHGRTSTYGKQ